MTRVSKSLSRRAFIKASAALAMVGIGGNAAVAGDEAVSLYEVVLHTEIVAAMPNQLV